MTRPRRSPLVRVGGAPRLTLDRNLEITGAVEAMTYVTVNPRIEAAEILELKADVGDRVAAGDVLATFDPTDAKMILDDAKVDQADAVVQPKDAEVALRELQAQANGPEADGRRRRRRRSTGERRRPRRARSRRKRSTRSSSSATRRPPWPSASRCRSRRRG